MALRKIDGRLVEVPDDDPRIGADQPQEEQGVQAEEEPAPGGARPSRRKRTRAYGTGDEDEDEAGSDDQDA